MKHITATPFGRRALDRAQMVSQQLAQAPAPLSRIDKWQVFHDLRTARDSFGLGDRDLTVLNALLSFLPARELAEDADLIVFPSNATLSDRAHGMAESTLRRHIAALVSAGVIARHDSPNGKRYARRDQSGGVLRAFGFSLRPLFVRAPLIAEKAEALRVAAKRILLLREAITLHLRDAGKLLAYLGETASPLFARFTDLKKAMRRKLPEQSLITLSQSAETLRREVDALLTPEPISIEPSGSDSQNERHYQNSKQDSQESESCTEQAPKPVGLALDLVLKACPDIETYARRDIRNWQELGDAAGEIHPMMGIDRSTWNEAQRTMGAGNAAATLAAMLQKIAVIRNPGGYLRRLSAKAAQQAFTPAPMIFALLGTGKATPVWS